MANGKPGRPRKDPALLEEQSKSFLHSDLEMKELKKVLKELGKQAKPAIEQLAKLMLSEDESISFKATSKLLEMQVELSKVISNDQLQRLIAEIKLNNQNRQLAQLGSDEGKSLFPVVDFTKVHPIQ
jgi:hypothetical protein